MPGEPDGPGWLDRVLRAIVIPEVDDAALDERRFLLVEAAPVASGAPVLRHAPVDAAGWTTLLTPWPGARLAGVGAAEDAWGSQVPRALSWIRDVYGAPPVILNLPTDRLRELSGAPERDERAAWMRLAGVGWGVDDGGAPAIPEGRAVAAPAWAEALRAFADHPSDATAARVHRELPGGVTVRRGLVREVLEARRDGVLCRAVAGAGPLVAPPWSGCWEIP